jgi:hypothetical protein
LHKFADNISRLKRWSLSLSDFDFTVEHTPGNKIVHVDALIRHVGRVEEPPLLSKLTLLSEQQKDPLCEKRKRIRFAKKSEFFMDVEGDDNQGNNTKQ